MSLVAVAQQAGITPEARVLHHPPALIQELVWQRPRSLGSSSRGESARKVHFSFYDGLLFRIAVNYEWDRTEGLTVDDMVEALSVTYGPAMLLAADTIPALSRVDTDGDRVVARWEDPEHSLTLVRPSHASTFGLVCFDARVRPKQSHTFGVQAMNVRPLHDRIIVRRLEEGEQKIGGIIIPDTAKEKPQQGKVIAAGNGKVNDEGKRVPLDVKAGDLILFAKYTSQEVKLDGEEYLIMREDEVLAVIGNGDLKKKK